MKRYLVFSFCAYYPEGGWHDFAGTFDTLPEAVARMKECLMGGDDNAHVIDSTTEERVA